MDAKWKQVLSFWRYVNLGPSQLPLSSKSHQRLIFPAPPLIPSALRVNSTHRRGAKPHPWLLMRHQSASTEPPYLLTSQILLVQSAEAEATKSPQECQQQPRTAREWPRRVRMQPLLDRSQSRTVVSPLDVTSWVPLLEGKTRLSQEGGGKCSSKII